MDCNNELKWVNLREANLLQQLEVEKTRRKSYHFGVNDFLIQVIHLDIIHLERCILHLEIVCYLSHEC